MNIAFVKRVLVAGGFLFLCAEPGLTLGQSSQPAAPPPMKSASPRNPAPPPDLLAGLTLTDDQKVRIEQIRDDTKSRLAAVANDKKLSPETANAMLVGYQRIENGKILAVLTPDQQREVRRRLSAWKAAAGERQPKLQQPPKGNSQPK